MFGWTRAKKKVSNSADQLDREALDAEETGEEFVRSSANRGPDGCGHKLKVALAIVKAYGASFKHWHWPWRKKKKTNNVNGQNRKMDEHLSTIDHCAAIAEREEYQRGHFDQRRRRRKRRGGRRRPRELNDKSALKALTRKLRRKNKMHISADHWGNIGVIRWGRRAIRDIRRPVSRKGWAQPKLKNRKTKKFLRKNRRRIKREGDEDEEEGDTDDEGGSDEDSSSDDDDGTGTKFKYSKTAHGYSNDKNAASNAKDKIYETVSFEAKDPQKGHYNQRTVTEFKFHGPKHSEWRHRPPKPPKAEGKAWTGKFKNRRREGGGRQSVQWNRKSGKTRRNRWSKQNWDDHDDGGGYYYTVAHPSLYPYDHYYGGGGYGSPSYWYSYSENYYGGDFGGYGGGYAAEEGGFMPSDGLGKAMKVLGIILFVLLLIIII
uniref:Btz domain-containing protein n=1 Tax=Globodera pallida TaxID=36090 RepID=A0A183BKD6_GLOPA